MLNTYGETGDASAGDFATGVKESTFGDVSAIKSVVTTGGTAQDWLAVVMLLTPGGKKGGDRSNKNHIAEPNTNSQKPKGEAGGGKKKKADADEGSSTKPRSRAPEKKAKKGKDGEAYADGGDAPISNQLKGSLGEGRAINDLKAKGYTDVIQIQNNSGHGVDVIARNPKTGAVKCVEVKANSSQLSEHQRWGGKKYVDNRLDRAVTGEGHNKIPPQIQQSLKQMHKKPKNGLKIHHKLIMKFIKFLLIITQVLRELLKYHLGILNLKNKE